MNKSKGVVYHILYFTIFVFLVTSCNTSSKSANDFTALTPGETLHGEWDGRVEGAGCGTTLAPPGCYQIVFPYALQEKRAIGEGWGDDQVRVSSNPYN